MPVTIPATVAHRKFGDLIKRAFSGKEHFIVEKEGLPVVAIISMAEYDELMREREQHEQDKQRRLKQFREAARAIGEEVAKTGLSEEEIMGQFEEVRQRLHDERYGKKRASSQACQVTDESGHS
jgi:prevent-host-death family protein